MSYVCSNTTTPETRVTTASHISFPLKCKTVPTLEQPIPGLSNFSHVISLFIFAAAFKALSNEETAVHLFSSVHSSLETASGVKYTHHPPLH